MDIDILKIKSHVWTGIISSCLIIASGSLLIYVFNKDLFLSLDLFKLIILSISVNIPAVITGVISATSLMMKNREDGDRDKDDKAFEYSATWLLSMIFNIMPLYLVIVARLICDISILSAIGILVLFQLFFLVTTIVKK